MVKEVVWCEPGHIRSGCHRR